MMEEKKSKILIEYRRPRQQFRAGNILHVLILPVLPGSKWPTLSDGWYITVVDTLVFLFSFVCRGSKARVNSERRL